MADGRAPIHTTSPRPAQWTQIFRCFQIAIDPRKLFVAAIGILVMSFLWWLLSVTFYYDAPKRNADEYGTANVQKQFEGRNNPATSKPYTNEELPLVAAAEADPADRIVVFGSFYTVGGVLKDGVPRLAAKKLNP